MRRWIFQALALLLVLAILGAGLLWLGSWSREQVRHQDRYTFALADIACPPPPGLTRTELLEEVQYLARLPDRLGFLEEGLAQRLADSFGRHPWVEEVTRVNVASDGVQVDVVYRTPVLAVRVGKTLRAVDRHGVLLPAEARTEGLPVFQGRAAPPAGPAGSRWGDAAVEAAARAANGR